jgi:Raf kinase inhibitor-like YbhB/YbcL family protein
MLLTATLSTVVDTMPDTAATFTVKSKAFEEGMALPTKYYGDSFGCNGGNLMPDLYWSNAPMGTKSFAVTLYDMDAPTGSGFWHYVAYDLPSETTHLPEGKGGTLLPPCSIEGNTDLGKPGFFGPCPPPGRLHHYIYSVYALAIDKLPVDQGSSPSMIGFMIWQHQLAKATLGFHVGPR